MNKHTISLKGPWTARVVVAGEAQSMRLNIKSRADWNAWQNECPNANELILKRKFNWIFPQPAPEKIELLIKSHEIPTGKLNGLSIDFEELDSVLSVDVTCMLKSFNQLELQFNLDHGGSLDLDSVELHSHG